MAAEHAQPAAKLDAPQLRTLLLTDLCDSTELVERIGDGAAAELFREHDHLVVQLQQLWRGRLIDRSDGLLLLFERPIDGLGFALDYAQGLLALGERRSVVLRARQGLHVGEVLTWRNSDEAVQIGAKPLEVEGLAKPTAARLMSMARPGQILLSAVAESLTHRAARELGTRAERLLWKSHGRWRFKGVPTAMEIYEVGEIGITPLRAPRNSPKAWRDVPLWRRPAALVAELSLVLFAGIAIWLFTRPQPALAFAERDWVVVGDVRNLTGDSLLDDSVEQAFRISLEQSRYINVLSDLKVRDTLRLMKKDAERTAIDRAAGSEIAIRDGARALVLPTVAEVGGRLRFSVEVIDPRTQTTVYAEKSDGRGRDALLGLIDQVTSQMRGRLGEALDAIEGTSRPLPQVATARLDALRAYALAEQAFGRRDWSAAEKLYEQAITIDPGFALAHLGLARIDWSKRDRTRTLEHLKRAWSLRASLSERERLYLDAWMEETSSEGHPLPKWKLLSQMYPEYFAGAANTSTHLMMQNRFSEALPYARLAAVPQDPLRAFAIDTIGRIQLANNDLSSASESFAQSQALLDKKVGLYTPVMLALAGHDREANESLQKLEQASTDPFSKLQSDFFRVAIAIAEQDMRQATSRANLLSESASQLEPTLSLQYGIVNQSVLALSDPRSVSISELKSLRDRLISAMKDPSKSSDQNLFRLLTLTYIAQRSGHADMAEELIEKLQGHIATSQDVAVSKMAVIVRAKKCLIDGDARSAISLLRPQLDGSEMIQTHVLLAEAEHAIGDAASSASSIARLSQQRGRAFVEYNVDLILMPINVFDTTSAFRKRNQERKVNGNR
ncbi:putative peptide modification system cyclase [Xanthomonas melonis]|uniref:Uncharacterized protein n=1 Tax=Xanthomonas melonis TaxID=56456 RepID=A0A2S7D9N4_9XANT|nr:putative peptide modification system cyclase [Xanthomonas melonis]MCC4602219.1 putative peptide modification system cyclase [Xanthomonas melonis]PPU70543.1 hypothetical protein XmelCFBP4644_19950 [Xanthomonas melonis]